MVQPKCCERLDELPHHPERVRAHHVAPGYPNALPVRAVMERLREATLNPHHEFWTDDVGLLDPQIADASRIH